MHSQLFSNKTRGFYPIKCLRYYKSVDTLPDDLVRVSDAEHEKFIGVAPVNCVPNYNVKTKEMEWLSVTPPVKTPEETLAANRAELTSRQRAAAINAFPLQSAVDLGVASDEVKAQLDELKKYVVALMAVDLMAPDWPAAPEWMED
ncbi:tail fiber assembly protein [Enterobacter asburiae]|uniref:tail fiber assembly protein n=1 Tax=Enterobacter asburiae TaxID=61645 RepID=UPI003BCB4C84